MEETDEKYELLGDIETQPDTKEDTTVTPKKTGWVAMAMNYMQAQSWLQKQRESVQPWGQFLNTSKFKVPKSIAPVGKRVIKNIDRFQSNYVFVFMGLILFCILTSPMLLVAIAACLGACYIISTKNTC